MCAACVSAASLFPTSYHLFLALTISPDLRKVASPTTTHFKFKTERTIFATSCWNQSQPFYLLWQENWSHHWVVAQTLMYAVSAYRGWTACSSPVSCLRCISWPCRSVHISLSQHLCLAASRHPILPRSVLMFDFYLTRCSVAAAPAPHWQKHGTDYKLGLFCKQLCGQKRLFIHIQERELFWSVCALWVLFPECRLPLRWSPSCYRPFIKCQRFTAPGLQH